MRELQEYVLFIVTVCTSSPLDVVSFSHRFKDLSIRSLEETGYFQDWSLISVWNQA